MQWHLVSLHTRDLFTRFDDGDSLKFRSTYGYAFPVSQATEIDSTYPDRDFHVPLVKQRD